MKTYLFPCLVLITTFMSCGDTNAPKSENNAAEVKKARVKPNYNEVIAVQFLEALYELDSLKPTLAEKLSDEYHWLLKLTEEEKKQNHQKINAIKTNLSIAIYFEYINALSDHCDVIKKEAMDLYSKKKFISIEDLDNFKKEYVKINDTLHYCDGTSQKLNEIKDDFINKWK